MCLWAWNSRRKEGWSARSGGRRVNAPSGEAVACREPMPAPTRRLEAAHPRAMRVDVNRPPWSEALGREGLRPGTPAPAASVYPVTAKSASWRTPANAVRVRIKRAVAPRQSCVGRYSPRTDGSASPIRLYEVKRPYCRAATSTVAAISTVNLAITLTGCIVAPRQVL